MLGIVHHDIKPRNIKLDDNGRAVLVDFGLAQRLSMACGGGRSGYTAAYAPPEQIRGEVTDGRSDLYALAATMYELLVRRMPPPALRRVACLRARRSDPLLPLDTIDPNMPRSLARLIGVALSLEPADRPSDARAMQQALAAIPLDAHAHAVRAPLIRQPRVRAARDLVTIPR
jgi:serine/threonine protein kinase